MNDHLVLLGAGGHGKVCADVAARMNRWSKILFLDDDQDLHGSIPHPIIGPLQDFSRHAYDSEFFVSIGDNQLREQIHAELQDNHCCCATLIHPCAIVAKGVSIGLGTVLMAGSIVNPNTKVGKGCVINTGSIIEHDCEIGNFVHNIAGCLRSRHCKNRRTHMARGREHS